MNILDKHIHLYNRAGFGLSPNQLSSKTNLNETIEKFLAPKSNFNLTSAVTYSPNWATLSKDQKQELRKKARKESQKLGSKWIKQMSTTDDVLLEKMTLFWHGHFACTITGRPDFGVQLNNIMRQHALGNFRDLTKAVAKEPAMLDYLNNTQNKKESPNENFAREVMELFTIGRDNYTETDIKETARAFTGWNHTKQGVFKLNKKHHDFGSKIFMNQTGDFDGNDIIDILCNDKRTSVFIAEKLYAFFVADEPNYAATQELAKVLYKNNYELRPTLTFLFTANWFYTSAGTKIKSPTELLVGLNRAYGVSYVNDKSLIFLQKTLGQHLFHPPNVAGWPGGKKWIDTSTLSYRMRVASIILNKGIIEWNVKDEPDKMVEFKTKTRNKAKKKAKNWLNANVNWEEIEQNWSMVTTEQFVALQLPSIRTTNANEMIKNSRTDIKSMAGTILALPEYQLC